MNVGTLMGLIGTLVNQKSSGCSSNGEEQMELLSGSA